MAELEPTEPGWTDHVTVDGDTPLIITKGAAWVHVGSIAPADADLSNAVLLAALDSTLPSQVDIPSGSGFSVMPAFGEAPKLKTLDFS